MTKTNRFEPFLASVGGSRRRFLVTLGAVGALALRPRQLEAEDEGVVGLARRSAIDADIVTHPVSERVVMLEGSGGNITVVAGRDATILVDAGFPVSRARILAAVQRHSTAPITHVVNTHWHFDHTDGNAWLHDSGAVIVGHARTHQHMSTSTHVQGWRHTFPPAPEAARPGLVVGDLHKLDANGVAVLLRHYPPGHTDSDLSVHLIDSNVLVTGDTWWNGHYPFIDYSTGGSIDGAITAAETNLAAADERTRVVPGHGPVGSRGDLREFRDMLLHARDAVGALKKQGRSLEEVVAARPLARYDATWGGFLVPSPMFVGLVYQGC
ncbi:MBL fold metallo-hydrolase [Luteitalea sp. TBR-22]|uniref:MBL fold metallo-hydrolase n=1 Tax=Luteitalea sp. TBR-22 TaxID=2802971 RepID=UPI001EF7219E|nr:MBL fold metallo-hydrolase [Luteitalea sp. TBR-22]